MNTMPSDSLPNIPFEISQFALVLDIDGTGVGAGGVPVGTFPSSLDGGDGNGGADGDGAFGLG